jgi:pimeloyl-ACP methyl ester carboxylesterase
MKQCTLFSGESLSRAEGFPWLTYYRAGSSDKPLVIFVPGGGHLARVAYGHDGADKQDFLDYWLGKLGYGLLTASYPSDYPIFKQTYPEMSISDWGKGLAKIASTVIEKYGLSKKIVILGWSMAGKMIGAFSQAANRLGLDLMCFISLSANLPLPGIVARRPEGEPLTPEGLWDIGDSDRPAMWMKELEAIERVEGHAVITPEDYQCFYRCNNPIQLRGEVDRLQDGVRLVSLEKTVNDVLPFSFSQYPTCAAIVPTSPSDAKHALIDSVSWAFYTMYAILLGKFAGFDFTTISQNAWDELRNLEILIPHRLTRYVSGGHLFFMGKTGASQTARYVEELVLESTRLEEMLRRLTG